MKIRLLRRRHSLTGGAERFTLRLAKALFERGVEVRVIAESWPDAEDGSYQVVRVNSRDPWRYALACQKHLKENPEGLVFSLERTFQQNIYRAGDGLHLRWLQRRAPFQNWISRYFTHWNPKHRRVLALERHTFSPQNTRLIIANSPMVQQEILEQYEFPPERVSLISPGVNLEKFKPVSSLDVSTALRQKYRLPVDEVVWSFVGSGFERKGLEQAIEIASRVRSSKIHLVVLGRGNPRRYQEIASRRQWSNQLHFLSTEVPAWEVYHLSDAFILPTIYDPCSNACLEAFACGLPVMTTVGNGAVGWIPATILEKDSTYDEQAEVCEKWACRKAVNDLKAEVCQRLDEKWWWNQVMTKIMECMS